MNPDRTTADAASGEQRYRFGDIVVDASVHTLVRSGQLQTVESKAFAVPLLRRANELVGRDELLDLVWGHRHVTPGVLTRAIAQLRNALGDDFHHPVYIQTQHGLGYRFIGTLLQQADAAAGKRCSDTVVGGPVYIGITYAPDGTPINPGNCRVASGTELTWRGPSAEPVAFEIRFKAAAPLARGERDLLRSAEAGGRSKVTRTISGPPGRYDYSILANGKELDPAIIIR